MATDFLSQPAERGASNVADTAIPFSGRAIGTRAALLLATMGTTAAACGGAEAVESTTPRPSDGVATTDVVELPTTTLGQPSSTTIETTVPMTDASPTTDAPTTTVAETATTAVDYSNVVPDLAPTVDISTPFGMAMTIQAISYGYLYTWDGYNNVTIDFSGSDLTREVSDTDKALVRAIYSPDLTRDGVPIGENFIQDLEQNAFDESQRRFYPVAGLSLEESSYGPVPGTRVVLDLPANATPDMLTPNEGIGELVSFYGDRVEVTTYAAYWQLLNDPEATVLTPEGDFDRPSPTMVFALDVITVKDLNGKRRFSGFAQSRVAAVWAEDNVTYSNVQTESTRTGAIVRPDGRVDPPAL